MEKNGFPSSRSLFRTPSLPYPLTWPIPCIHGQALWAPSAIGERSATTRGVGVVDDANLDSHLHTPLLTYPMTLAHPPQKEY